jgi:uncharacterized protein (TIGR02246 family)
MSGMDATGDRNLSPQQIRSTIEQARKAWIAGDADTLAELFTPDAQLIVPSQLWQGREQIRAEIAKFAREYENISITIYRIIIDGDRAAVEWHYEDRERATGKRNQSDEAIVIEFQHGLICYWREYFDPGVQ